LQANLQLQLQKTQNSNSELLLAVTDLEAMLEQKNNEICLPIQNPRRLLLAVTDLEATASKLDVAWLQYNITRDIIWFF